MRTTYATSVLLSRHRRLQMEVSPDLLVRVLVELVANYWSWPGGGYNPTTPELVSN